MNSRGVMLLVLLALLLGANACWMVGVVLPAATHDLKARALAGLCGGAFGSLLFHLFGASLASVVASILATMVTGIGVVAAAQGGVAWLGRNAVRSKAGSRGADPHRPT